MTTSEPEEEGENEEIQSSAVITSRPEEGDKKVLERLNSIKHIDSHTHKHTHTQVSLLCGCVYELLVIDSYPSACIVCVVYLYRLHSVRNVYILYAHRNDNKLIGYIMASIRMFTHSQLWTCPGCTLSMSCVFDVN